MNIRYYYICISLFLTFNAYSQSQDDIYLQGVVMIQNKEYQSAVDLFSQLIETDNFNADYYMKRGEALMQKGDYYIAINDFKGANKIKRNIADLDLAKCYAHLNEEEKMYNALESHLKSRYKLKESDIKFSPAFGKYHKTDDWIDFWKNNWYTNRDYAISEVEYLIKYENYQQALDRVNEELKHGSRNHELFAARAKVYEAMLHYPKAENDYSKAIDLNSRTGSYFLGRGKINLKLEKYDKAIEDFHEALELEPQQLHILKLRSRAYEKDGNFDKALEDIKTYLSYFPEEEDALFQCGNMHYNFEKYLDALIYYNKCLEKNAERADYFEARGNAYYQVKTYKYAIRDYSMALDLHPDSPDAYVYKGLSRKAIGDGTGACSDWEKAQRLGSRKAKELLINHCQ